MILQLVLIFSVFTAHAEFEDSEKQNLLCKNGKVVRSLAYFVDKEKNECSTVYTKGGIDREIGSGKNFSTCKEVFNQVKGTLEKAAWKCRDVSTLQVFDN